MFIHPIAEKGLFSETRIQVVSLIRVGKIQEYVADERVGTRMERMKERERLASVGTFCPNKECHHYAKVEEANIIEFGKSKQGVQRYRCKSCRTSKPSWPRPKR